MVQTPSRVEGYGKSGERFGTFVGIKRIPGSSMAARPHPTLLKSDYERLAALRYQLRRFLRTSEREAQAVGLTPRQYQALLAIAGCPEREALTVGALAEQLLVAPHSAVGLVDRLCAQGVLERRPGPVDRRQVLVRLTARGTTAREKLAHAHRAELRQVGLRLRACRRETGANRRLKRRSDALTRGGAFPWPQVRFIGRKRNG
jgi:DNA-binding MarR family transcriptional regulator